MAPIAKLQSLVPLVGLPLIRQFGFWLNIDPTPLKPTGKSSLIAEKCQAEVVSMGGKGARGPGGAGWRPGGGCAVAKQSKALIEKKEIQEN